MRSDGPKLSCTLLATAFVSMSLCGCSAQQWQSIGHRASEIVKSPFIGAPVRLSVGDFVENQQSFNDAQKAMRCEKLTADLHAFIDAHDGQTLATTDEASIVVIPQVSGFVLPGDR